VVGVNAAGVFGTGTSARLAPLTSAPTVDPPAITPPGGTDQTSTPKGPSSVPPVAATGQVLPAVRPVSTRIWPAAFVEAQLAAGETSGPAQAEVVAVPADAAVPSSSPANAPAAAPIPAAPRHQDETPAASTDGLGVLPWILGIIVLLGVVAVSVIYRPRNSA
jgi:hypothetical protein